MSRKSCVQSVDYVSGRPHGSIAIRMHGKEAGGGCKSDTSKSGRTGYTDTSDSFLRILFMDFSSAVNTIQTHLLLKRLIDSQANSSLVLWIISFLCDRPQRVSVRGCFSDELVLNSGAPQSCVLSPVLSSIYIPMKLCVTTVNAILTLVMFADDMALIAGLKDECTFTQYFLYIDTLLSWFDDSFLELNVQKTKEVCIEGGRAGAETYLCFGH